MRKYCGVVLIIFLWAGMSLAQSESQEIEVITTFALGEDVIISDIAFDGNSNVLAVAGRYAATPGGIVALFDTTAPFERRNLYVGDSRLPHSVVIDSKSAQAIVSMRTPLDGFVEIYDLSKWTIEGQFKIENGYAETLALCPQDECVGYSVYGQCCYSVERSDRIRNIYQLINLKERETEWSVASVQGLGPGYGSAISPSGDLVAFATTNTEVHILDSKTGEELATLDRANTPHDFEFTITGMFAYITSDGVRMWDINPIDDHKQPTEYRIIAPTNPGKPEAIVTFDLNSSATLLAAGHLGGAVSLWDVETSEQLVELEGLNRVTNVQFSPNDELLAAGDVNGNVMLWSIRDKTIAPR